MSDTGTLEVARYTVTKNDRLYGKLRRYHDRSSEVEMGIFDETINWGIYTSIL